MKEYKSKRGRPIPLNWEPKTTDELEDILADKKVLLHSQRLHNSYKSYQVKITHGNGKDALTVTIRNLQIPRDYFETDFDNQTVILYYESGSKNKWTVRYFYNVQSFEVIYEEVD